MHASTHALGLHAPADFCLPRLRETRGVGAATGVTSVDVGALPQRAADELAGRRSRSLRIRARLGGHVENVLFAITLAAIGYLYLGACPLQAF